MKPMTIKMVFWDHDQCWYASHQDESNADLWWFIHKNTDDAALLSRVRLWADRNGYQIEKVIYDGEEQ